MPASMFYSQSDVIDTLRVSLTGECNLNCFYCKPTGAFADLKKDAKQMLTPSDLSKIVKIMADIGLRKVQIKGGEPLLRKDAANFIKSSFAHKAIEDVRLFTNGTFLKAFGDALKKYGLRKVTINLDSLQFAKFQKITGSDALYRVLDGVEKVEKLNFTDIRLNITLFDGINNDEIVRFARMTKDRKIHVSFREYRCVDSEQDPYKNRANRLGIVEAKRMIDGYQIMTSISPLQNEDHVPTFVFKDSLGKVSFVSKAYQDKQALEPRMVLTSEGILLDETDSKKSMDLLGELRKDPKSLKLRRNVEKFMTLKSSNDSAIEDKYARLKKSISRKKPSLKARLAAKKANAAKAKKSRSNPVSTA